MTWVKVFVDTNGGHYNLPEYDENGRSWFDRLLEMVQTDRGGWLVTSDLHGGRIAIPVNVIVDFSESTPSMRQDILMMDKAMSDDYDDVFPPKNDWE